MARVDIQVSGGDVIRGRDFRTLGQLKQAMGCQGFNGQVNGSPETDNHILAEHSFVTLTENMKGA